MTASGVRVTAVVALIVLATAVLHGGPRVSACPAAGTHTDTCAESCDVDAQDAGRDISALVFVVSSGEGQPALVAAGHTAAIDSAPPHAGFRRAVDRPPCQ